MFYNGMETGIILKLFVYLEIMILLVFLDRKRLTLNY
jgi:hypothetical protein